MHVLDHIVDSAELIYYIGFAKSRELFYSNLCKFYAIAICQTLTTNGWRCTLLFFASPVINFEIFLLLCCCDSCSVPILVFFFGWNCILQKLEALEGLCWFFAINDSLVCAIFTFYFRIQKPPIFTISIEEILQVYDGF